MAKIDENRIETIKKMEQAINNFFTVLFDIFSVKKNFTKKK